jgi:transcriptional regulator with XRE-family HTH domain
MMQGSLAQQLRVLRARRGLTLTEASKSMGITRHTLAALERGDQDPHYPTLLKIAEFYEVPVEELLEETVLAAGKAEAPKTGQRSSEESLMSRPEVREWLLKQGHVPPEEFPSLALDLSNEDEIDEAIDELDETKARILEGLRDPSVQKTLFGSVRPGDFEGRKARMGEVFRPGKLASKLEWEIRSEYLAKETALVNYGRELFAEGKADDYLVRGPVGEHDHVRHELMLEERRRVLEEKYAAQLAAV